MEYFRKTYYTDSNFLVTIMVNNRKSYMCTRLTIKQIGKTFNRRVVYTDITHHATAVTEIYDYFKRTGVSGNTTREVIEEITDKIVYIGNN